MDKIFLTKFAFENLLNHKSRAVLTILGVMIGISAIIFLVSFAFGLENQVTSQVARGDAYRLIDVGPQMATVMLNEDAEKKIKEISSVKAVELSISTGSVIKQNDKKYDATLSGTSDQYLSWSGGALRWGKGITEAEKNNLATRPFLANTAFIKLLGKETPSNYLGQKFSFDILLTRELTGVDNKNSQNNEFVLSGIVESDSQAPNVYIDSQELIKLGVKNYSQFKLEATDQTSVASVRKQIENLGFKTEYVGDSVTQINQIFNVFKMILGGFGLIALIVAAIGMFNTLTISLLERTKEVALMKILGMRKRDILSVFLFESVLLGVVGGVLGLMLGMALNNIANKIFNHYAAAAGADNISLFLAPSWFLIATFVFALVVGVLTGLYPARRATRVHALDVLRYE